MKRIALLLFLAAVGGSAFGTDTTDYSTYVQFTAVCTEESYSFSRQTGWKPSEPPKAGAKNYVPEGKVLASEYSASNPDVFKGDELALAGGFLHARSADKTTEVPTLAFTDGGYYTIPGGSNPGRGTFVSANTIIRASSSNPAQLRWPANSAKTSCPALNLTLYGEPDAELQAVNVGEGSSTYGFNLTGSLANYRGTLTIAEGARLRFGMADNSVPATLKVAEGGVLDMSQFTSDFTVGTFDWSDGGVLSVPVTAVPYAKLAVTNAFLFSGEPKIVLAGVSGIDPSAPPVYPIIELSGPAAESVPDLSAIVADPVAGALSDICLVVTENPDGTKTVSVTWKAVENLMVEDAVVDARFLSKDLKVGTLTLGDGGVIRYDATDADRKLITVTSALQISGKAMFELAGLDYVTLTNNASPHYPVLRLTGDAAVNVPDVSALTIKPFLDGLPHGYAAVEDGETAGEKIVYLTWRPIVYLLKSYNSTDNKYSAWQDGNQSYWSSGDFPTSEQDVLINLDALYYSAASSTLKGNSLTVCKSSQLRLARGVTVKELNLGGGSTLLFNGGSPDKTMKGGPLTVFGTDSAVHLKGYGSQVHLENDLCGEGTVDINMQTGSKTIGYSLEFLGDNSAFHGRLLVQTPNYAGKPSSGYPATPDLEKGYFTKLYISNASHLGGAYSGSDGWQAVTIKNCARLYVEKDIVLAEPTRGVSIVDDGYISVAGATLALKSQLTLNGNLVKVGDGTLELGGTVAFTDGDPATEPTAEKNLLTVSEGALKVTSSNACDGVAISFAEGTRLVVDVSATGDGVRTFGLVNTRAGGSLAVAGDALNVTFVGAAPAEDGFEAAVCTLPLAAAQALKVSVVCKVRGYRVMKTDVRDNLDGTGTVFANFERKGLCVILR